MSAERTPPNADPMSGAADLPAPERERYEFRRKIGAGGVGAVYEAFDTQLERAVAIKRLLPPDESEDRGRIGGDLAKEAAALSALQHPNIVSIFDIASDGDGIYVVMELIRGETLEETVARGVLTLPDFARLAEQVLEGLAAAHAVRLLHRDLKPSNVMVTWHASGKFQAKLLDFGLAKFAARPAVQTADQSQSILGSIYFMAPEQFERRPLDARTDLYSAGCLFFYTLTGRHPFDGKTAASVMTAHLQGRPLNLAALRPDLPAGVIQWVMWHLNVEQRDRPGSAQASLEALQGVLAGGEGHAPASAPRPAMPVQRAAAAGPVTAVIPATAQAPRLVTGAVATAYPASRAAGARPRSATEAYLTAHARKRRDARVRGTRIASALIGIALAAAALWGAWVLFFRPPVSAGDGDAAPAATVGGRPAPGQPAPPQDDLAVWLDAGWGTFADEGSTRAVPGEKVAHWGDRAELFGDNAAEYHTTVYENPRERWPELAEAPGELPGGAPRRAIRFAGNENLVIGRAIPGGTDAIAGDLAGGPITIAAAVRPAADLAEPTFLFGAKLSDGGSLTARFENGEAVAAVSGGGEDAQARAPAAAGRPLVCLVSWDRKTGQLQIRTAPAGGDAEEPASGAAEIAADSIGDVREIRLGTGATADPDGGSPFHGDVLEVLVYRTILDEGQINSCLAYLGDRHLTGAEEQPRDASP